MRIETISDIDETEDVTVSVDVHIREAILPNGLVMELAAQDVMDYHGCAREDFTLELTFRTPIPDAHPWRLGDFHASNKMSFKVIWKDVD